MKTLKQPQILQSELNKISRYLKEVSKFGYKPWVNVRQSHTYGQGHEIFCHKTQRTHCLLSRGERPIFFELERNPSVIELFEQYPLPISETMELAVELNILHPGAYKERHKNDGVIPAKTMSSDIVALKKLKNGKDKSAELIAKQKYILSITVNGYGKRTSYYDYRVTNRGGKGIIGIINSSRNGNVASSFPVNEGDEILMSTNKGRVIRTASKEIRIAGRNTQGVRIIKLSGEEKVVSAIKIVDNLK